MGKTRDLFKKIRATKGTFHAKMGRIKDRNGMDLTEAERKPGKNTQKNYTKKIIMTQMLNLYTGILNDCDYFGKEFSCDVYKQMGALSRG